MFIVHSGQIWVVKPEYRREWLEDTLTIEKVYNIDKSFSCKEKIGLWSWDLLKDWYTLKNN